MIGQLKALLLLHINPPHSSHILRFSISYYFHLSSGMIPQVTLGLSFDSHISSTVTIVYSNDGLLCFLHHPLYVYFTQHIVHFTHYNSKGLGHKVVHSRPCSIHSLCLEICYVQLLSSSYNYSSPVFPYWLDQLVSVSIFIPFYRRKSCAYSVSISCKVEPALGDW